MKKKLGLLIAATLLCQQGMAQFEDDFTDPESSNLSAGDTPSVLTKDKKEKISKASSEEITKENYPELIDSFDYNNADINDVIKAISELTGKNFIIDPAVKGKITIIAPTKISVAEAYKAFLASLAINGYTVVPSGDFLKVKSARNAQRDNIETYSGAYFPNNDQMITRIIHLKHISAEQVNRELRILQSRDGEMSIYAPTNSIILSDYGSNIERVMKIINQLDVPGFEEKLTVIPIKYAKSKDIAELVNKIVNKDSSSANQRGGTFSAGVPRFSSTANRTTTSGGSGSAYFMVIPDDRTNSLIVVGNTPGITRVRKLITQLDFKIRLEDQGGVYVYYVKHGDAEKISQTLTGIAKENKPTSPTSGIGGGPAGAPGSGTGQQEVFGGDVKIAADKETNSLIVTASRQDYEVVLNLLSKIDIPRDQVFVEAIIMEMAVGDDGKYGIGYFKFDDASKGVGRAGFNGFSSTELTSLFSPLGGEGAILPFGSNKSVEIDLGGTKRTVKDLTGFMNLIKRVGRTNVLSTPNILAIDNEEAELEVGQEVAVGFNESTTANGITSKTPNYKDASLSLKIKPFISPSSDTIRMKIVQKQAQPISNPDVPGTLNIAKRRIETNIVVPDGDTAVLGGLIKDEEQESITKVPVLGDIPVLGWLFKSRQIKKTKTNLLVFLTPKIIRNLADSQGVLSKKLDQRLDFIKQTGGRDPYGKQIEKFPRRSAEVTMGSPKTSSEPIKSQKRDETQPTIETNKDAGGLEEGEESLIE